MCTDSMQTWCAYIISYVLLFDQQAIELKDKHPPRSGWGTRLDQKCAQTCSALWQMMMTTWIKIRYASFLIYLSRTFDRKKHTVGVKLRGTLGTPSWKCIACSAGGRKSLTGSRFTMILVRKSRWANWWWVGEKNPWLKEEYDISTYINIDQLCGYGSKPSPL